MSSIKQGKACCQAPTRSPIAFSAAGFTLIELMIVVVIIGILAAIAVPRFSNVAKNAKQAEANSALKQIYTLQLAYYQKGNSYAPLASLTGWEDPDMKYFDTPPAVAVDNSASPPTFCAGYSPNAAGPYLQPRSIDQDRKFYKSTDCDSSTEIDP